jgi:hypothetical protein
MPTYKVNKDAVDKARKLIDDGDVDTTTDWSDAAPSTDGENSVIDSEGYDGYGQWHLGIEEGASEETKGQVRLPVRRLQEGQPGRPDPRQAAGVPERLRRHREGRGRAAATRRQELLTRPVRLGGPKQSGAGAKAAGAAGLRCARECARRNGSATG